jgi:tetratricopeptide (TPR) repeat protein
VGLSLQGDYVRAAELYQESLTLGREQGHALLVGWASFYLGALGLRQGDAGQARALLAKSLPVFQEYGDTIGIVKYLEGMAEVAGLEGQPARLVRLFGAVVPLHARFGVSSFPAEQAAYERQLLAARAQLGEDAYNLAWAAGQALTLEQAIAEALNR